MDESIEAYRSLATRSFTLKIRWLFPFVFNLATLLPNLRCRFDCAELEHMIKGLVKWKLENENELLLQDDPNCKM
jgi:hypothetical protein